MKIISIRENPEYKGNIIQYLQNSWSKTLPSVYEDCLNNCIESQNPSSQWYILEHEGSFLGCAGLIANSFTNTTDFYPWKGESYTGTTIDSILLTKAKEYAINAGFEYLYLCTEDNCWVV